ncbi:hypothetical protein [Streptomyces sp. NPDC047028]|uniref:hypothetical protein n=1 Tax=Streptomyces sp. NPDC047028 TaxID=3155793 RepID=UPI0033E72E95
MSVKTALSSAVVLLAGTVALTACGGSADAAGTPATGGQKTHAAASTPAAAGATHSAPARTASKASATVAAHSDATSTSTSHGAASAHRRSGGGHATSDSWAWTHPCTSRGISVHVVHRSGAASQRVIEVRNLGSDSCGLSYFPLVSIDNSHAANGGTVVKPLIPGGLGGAPAYPVYAGRTAYAVIDLDPSGATTGTVPGMDELNVLANGDHMSNAETLNFSLGSGAHVKKPKLGLYRSTVADAVTSMRSADTQS